MSSSTRNSGNGIGSWLVLLLVLWCIYQYPWIILLTLLIGGVVLTGGLYILHLDNQSTQQTNLHQQGLKLHSRILDLAVNPEHATAQHFENLEIEIKLYSKLVKEHGGRVSPTPRDLATLLKHVRAVYGFQPEQKTQKPRTAKPKAKPSAKPKQQLTTFETQVAQCLTQAQSVANFENTPKAGQRRVLLALAENITKDEKNRQAIVEACLTKLSST